VSTRPKRPRDTNQLAKLMVDILTGEDRERTPEERGVDPAASTAANGNTVVVVDQTLFRPPPWRKLALGRVETNA
jgi:hypothetical protein